MDVVEIPWGWYISRSSGIVGFLLLYAVMFLGLAIRMPYLKKIIPPCDSHSVHCWLSLQAFIFALIHGLALLFDKFFSFELSDIFFPFSFQSDLLSTNLVALGIISFYLMLVLIISSYARRYIGQVSWRLIHFSNSLLYLFTIVHAYNLGTDLKIPIVRNIFIGLNIVLVFLMLSSIVLRIIGWKENNKLSKNDADLCESGSPFKPEQSGENFRRRL